MNQRQSERQIRELLTRYIREECTEQEVALVEKWYERVRGDKKIIRLLSAADEERLVIELWKATGEKEGESMSDDPGGDGEAEGPEEGVGREDEGPGTVNGRAGRLNSRRIFRHAAIWTGLIVVTGWALTQIYKRSYRLSLHKELVFKEVVTGYQEVIKVLLPDGSVVWLNSATHLSYDPEFIRHREVRLSGEAFFEVVPDPLHPFVVRAGNASTRVIGTAFNVSAYPEAGQMRISLKSGKVGIEYENKTGRVLQELAPGELLIFDKESSAGQIVHEAPGEMDVWTGGQLLFYKTPLKEAFAQIEARYGIHIIYDHPLKDQTITARFENTALEKVLQTLSFGWDLHFTRSKDILHVH
jgi:ferric-dicitrate binding protein FerR (iron transport regulator)